MRGGQTERPAFSLPTVPPWPAVPERVPRGRGDARAGPPQPAAFPSWPRSRGWGCALEAKQGERGRAAPASESRGRRELQGGRRGLARRPPVTGAQLLRLFISLPWVRARLCGTPAAPCGSGTEAAPANTARTPRRQGCDAEPDPGRSCSGRRSPRPPHLPPPQRRANSGGGARPAPREGLGEAVRAAAGLRARRRKSPLGSSAGAGLKSTRHVVLSRSIRSAEAVRMRKCARRASAEDARDGNALSASPGRPAFLTDSLGFTAPRGA